MAELRVGSKAPVFKALTDEGKEISLADFLGRKVVLYFYPRDNTPGCTRESCSFRDGLSQITQKGAAVLGVSSDSVASHQKFKTDHGLNFPLLSDADKKLIQAYGVTSRTTFLIDEAGRIARIFPQVQVDGHFDEVLASL
jgi:thioredoxin-dependent peroxiredoxin